MMKKIKVAVCGNLPTACEYLLRQGVVQVDHYLYATEIVEETDYHLILIHAPHAEGLLSTFYIRNCGEGTGSILIPLRMLNEPCCHSALLELKLLLRHIANEIKRKEP